MYSSQLDQRFVFLRDQYRSDLSMCTHVTAADMDRGSHLQDCKPAFIMGRSSDSTGLSRHPNSAGPRVWFPSRKCGQVRMNRMRIAGKEIFQGHGHRRLVGIPFTINTIHSNIIVIDQHTKLAWWFEPHGWDLWHKDQPWTEAFKKINLWDMIALEYLCKPGFMTLGGRT